MKKLSLGTFGSVSIIRRLAVLILFAGLVLPFARTFAEPAPPTVTFNCTAGAEVEYTQEFVSGESEALDPEACTFTGRTFGGWATSSANATDKVVAFADGQSVNLSTSRTLYAIWLGTFTVTFDGNGAESGSMTDQVASADNTALTTNGFTDSTHTFMGWNDTSAADAKTGTYDYVDEADYDFITDGDVTLYAVWKATVTFDGNYGTCGTATQDGYGTAEALTSAEVLAAEFSCEPPAGRTFMGWNSVEASADAGTVQYADAENYNFWADGDVTLYAVWAASVTFNGNGADGGPCVATQEGYADNIALTANACTYTDHTFMGWNDTSAADAKTGTVDYVDEADYDFETDGSDTLYAVWKATVTFDGNDGTCGTATQDGYDTSVALATNTCTLAGFTFVGWNSDGTAADAGTVEYLGGADYNFWADGDVTLYAVWGGTVTFNANGGTGSMTNQVASTDATTLTTNGFSLSGRTFKGWATSSGNAATGTVAYLNTATYPFLTNGDTELYAVWAATVTFNGNGADGGPCVATQEGYADNIALTANACTYTDHTFMGWNDTSAADAKTGTVDYVDEADYDFDTDGSDTLYAVWKATVTFDGNGGTCGTATQDGYDTSVALATNTCTLAGFTFVGWNSDGTAADAGTVEYLGGADYNFWADGDVTLYAVWGGTVTFNANGGTGSMTNQVASTDATTLTTNGFSLSGRTFKGWNSDETAADAGTVEYLGGANYDFLTNGDVTLYAVWAATVTFNANGGGGCATAQDGIADNVALTTNTCAWVGRTFMGWNDTSAADAKTGTVDYADEALYDFDTDGSDTLYAVWRATVTFDSNGGSGCVATQNGYDTSVALATNTCTLAGFTFVGWNSDETAANAGTVEYLGGANYDFWATGSDTVHAVWGGTVTFNANGGSGSMTNQVASTDNTVLGSNSFAWSGYTFSHWSTIADGTGDQYANAGQYDFLSAGNETLFAQWVSSGGGGGGGGGGGSSSAAPINTVSPELSGFTSPGASVVATSGTWEGASSYSFQWYRCTTASAVTQVTVPAGCVAITGADSATYLIQATDNGYWLRVRVRATGSGGATDIVSATSAKVGAKPESVKARPPRVMNGLASAGSTLAAKRGQWTNGPVTYAYQWYRCTKAGLKNPKSVPVACTAITGATAKTYTVKAADKGSYLRVRVTATGATGQGFRMSRTTGIIPN